jgi:hypothetical protein
MAATTRKPGRPAKGHIGRQRKLSCADCGFICYATATAIRERGVPTCACGKQLVIANGRDALKVSSQAALSWCERRQDALDESTEAEYAEWAAKDARRVERERRREFAAFPEGACNCRKCGYFKSRPADECVRCGDSPLTYGEDPRACNRAYGYAA